MRMDYRLSAITMVLAIIALLFAGGYGHFAPAPTPTDAASEVASFYQQHRPRILIFAFFNTVSCVLFLPACCALSAAMLRMQPTSPVLALVQVVGGVFALIGPFLAGMFLAAAAVRPDAAPAVLASLTDVAVLFIELSTLPALLQAASLAIAISRDRSPVRILPTWFGWISLIWGILAQGGLLAIFFETGPLSQNGFIGIVLPIVSLVIWMAAAAFVLFRIKPHQP